MFPAWCTFRMGFIALCDFVSFHSRFFTFNFGSWEFRDSEAGDLPLLFDVCNFDSLFEISDVIFSPPLGLYLLFAMGVWCGCGVHILGFSYPVMLPCY